MDKLIKFLQEAIAEVQLQEEEKESTVKISLEGIDVKAPEIKLQDSDSEHDEFLSFLTFLSSLEEDTEEETTEDEEILDFITWATSSGVFDNIDQLFTGNIKEDLMLAVAMESLKELSKSIQSGEELGEFEKFILDTVKTVISEDKTDNEEEEEEEEEVMTRERLDELALEQLEVLKAIVYEVYNAHLVTEYSIETFGLSIGGNDVSIYPVISYMIDADTYEVIDSNVIMEDEELQWTANVGRLASALELAKKQPELEDVLTVDWEVFEEFKDFPSEREL